jgi:type I restriction enzyme S subunit
VDFDPVRRNMARNQGRGEASPANPGEQRPHSDASPLQRGLPTPNALADLDALFPDSFEDSELGQIPQGWIVKPIGEMATIVGGSTPSTKGASYWEGGTIYWATPKDLSLIESPALIQTERCITEAGLQQISSGLLPKGSVLLSSRAPIGYLAIAEMPLAINQGFIAIKCDRELPNQYVLQWTYINMAEIKGRANGTTFMEINKANFRSIPALLPGKLVLDLYNELTDIMHRRLVSNLYESRTLTTIRDTLLPKLLSGEVRMKGIC